MRCSISSPLLQRYFFLHLERSIALNGHFRTSLFVFLSATLSSCHLVIRIMLAISLFLLVASAQAHTVGWAPGMYCRNGTSGVDDDNTNTAVNPLFNLTRQNWWFQHDRGCDAFPPRSGEFLTLPAGGKVTLELAHNRGQTTLSYGGKYASDWPDGNVHPENWNGTLADPGEGCIQDDGAMHASNHADAAGTALAISYVSDIKKVTMQNLVVFSVLAK